MFPIQDQISIVTRASLENQFATFTALTNKTFEGMEKLLDLNVNVAMASLEESSVIMQQLLAAKGPQEFFSLITAQAQPNAEKAVLYSRHLANIAASTQVEFAQAAEAQFAEANRKVTELVEDAAKKAPAGSENVVALVKSAIDNASAGYEQLSKTTKQASEAIEANLNAVAAQFAQTSEKAAAQ